MAGTERRAGWPGLMVAALGGCRGAQSALEPRGPLARALFDLYNVMWIGGTLVFATVLLLLWRALRARQPAPHPQQRRAVLFGTCTTIALLIALLVYNMLVSRIITAQPENAVQVEIVARQWWWEVSYPQQPTSRSVRTANELHVPVGRPVALTLKTPDVVHSFWVPNLHGKMDILPGRENRIWLQADEPGVYRGQCAEFCGLQHAHMALMVVAEPPSVFERWLTEQNAPAREPPDALAARGRTVFMASSCPMCHSVRGTLAMAAAGPDLTHLASRRTLAAATLPNGTGQLAGWIADPQHIKPGNAMPRNPLDGDSLQALVHYLESLR